MKDKTKTNPSNDLIKRKDAIEAIWKKCENAINVGDYAYTAYDVERILSSLPSAEATGALDEAITKYVADGYMLPPNALSALPSAEAVQGEWIRVGHDIYECSLCHQNVMTRDIDCYAYCHGCGARMKGKDNEID